jgi:hypothetical protein
LHLLAVVSELVEGHLLEIIDRKNSNVAEA